MNKLEKTDGFTKEEIKELYIIYMSIILNNKKILVSDVIEIFKEDSADWFKVLGTTLSKSLHAYLSKQFINDTSRLAEEASVNYLQRFRNSDNIWEYSINLEDERVKSEIVLKVDSLLGNLELEYIIDSNNKIIERFVHNYEEIFISGQKVINLWEWRDMIENDLFENALTVDQFAQLNSEFIN